MTELVAFSLSFPADLNEAQALAFLRALIHELQFKLATL
jgi:hypothetical protein